MFFSSVAAFLGAPGQANYSAANAALDGYARGLHKAGSPVMSVQWGAWAGGGMAAQDKQTSARLERLGMTLIQPQEGLRALEGECLPVCIPHCTVMYRHVLACTTMYHHVLPCTVMYCHALPCNAICCHALYNHVHHHHLALPCTALYCPAVPYTTAHSTHHMQACGPRHPSLSHT